MKPALLILCGLMLAHQAAQGVRAAEGVIPNIPAGRFIAGSDQAERDAAYDLDQAAYGHDRTLQWGWYDNERPRSDHHLPVFAISRTLITNRPSTGIIIRWSWSPIMTPWPMPPG